MLLDEDDFRSSSQALELGDVLLPLRLRVTVLVLWSKFCAPPFWSTNKALPVPVWSLSTCSGVNTQRSVNSCPHTGLAVPVESVTLSCFSWLRVSRSNLACSRVSSLHFVTSLTVLDNCVLVLDRFVGCLYCFLLLLNPILSRPIIFEGNRWRRTRWHIYLLVYDFVQISSQLPSRYNKLGVYRGGWLRSILPDRASILFVEQAVYRPNTPYPGAFSTFSRSMQDVVWSNWALADLCDSYSWDSRL